MVVLSFLENAQTKGSSTIDELESLTKAREEVALVHGSELALINFLVICWSHESHNPKLRVSL